MTDEELKAMLAVGAKFKLVSSHDRRPDGAHVFVFRSSQVPAPVPAVAAA